MHHKKINKFVKLSGNQQSTCINIFTISSVCHLSYMPSPGGAVGRGAARGAPAAGARGGKAAPAASSTPAKVHIL